MQYVCPRYAHACLRDGFTFGGSTDWGGGGGVCVVQVRGVWFVLAVNSGTSEHAKEEARGDDAFGRG